MWSAPRGLPGEEAADVVQTVWLELMLDMPRGNIRPTRGRCLAKLRVALLSDPSWAAG